MAKVEEMESERFEIERDGSMLGGRMRRASSGGSARPVIVAIHGGTYTSAYFDVPGHSLLGRAAEAGFDIVAPDRPGYGASTALEDAPDLIQKNAERLDRLMPAILQAIGRPGSPVVLVGHSIGGAIVVSLAALGPAWDLAGIAVSGVGVVTPPESAKAYATLPREYFVELPGPMKDRLMFRPAGTHPPTMPAASHVANANVPRSELLDITGGWPGRLRQQAGRVGVPVHYRQGGHEKLWIVGEEMVRAFAGMFAAAPSVDAALIPDAGHCIDFHHAGAAFQDAQLAFAAAITGARK